MSIDTRFTPAIRNALLTQMQDLAGRFTPDGSERLQNENGSAPTPGSDRVSLSDAARHLQASFGTSAGSDVFDAERVAELKLAVGSGMYSIDPVRVADKFHRFNQDL